MQGRVGIESRSHPITSQTIVQPDSGLTVRTKTGARSHKRKKAPLTGSPVADLRLAKSRILAEQIASRAAFLPRSERLLLEQLYIHGWPASRIATLTGERARTIRQRARRLAQRVMSPAFAFVTVGGHTLDDEHRRLAAGVFVRGLSVRRASVDIGIPYWRALMFVRAMRTLAAASAAWKRGAA
jgi:hypothetical protein